MRTLLSLCVAMCIRRVIRSVHPIHRCFLLSIIVGVLLAGTLGAPEDTSSIEEGTPVATESQSNFEGLDGPLLEDSLVGILSPDDSEIQDIGSNGGQMEITGSVIIREVRSETVAPSLQTSLVQRLSNATLVVEGTVVLGPGVLVQPCTEAAAIVPRQRNSAVQQASTEADVVGVEIRGHFKGPVGFAPMDSDVAGTAPILLPFARHTPFQ